MSKGMVICSKCGKVVEADCRFCSSCGGDLKAAGGSSPAYVPPAQNYSAQTGLPPNRPPYSKLAQTRPMQGISGTALIVIGVIIDIVGLIMLISGNVMANDVWGQVRSILMTGSYNAGTTIMVVGIILMVVGTIIGFIGRAKNNN